MNQEMKANDSELVGLLIHLQFSLCILDQQVNL